MSQVDIERERTELMLASKDLLQEIIPSLYLTSRFGAQDKAKLLEKKITHVVEIEPRHTDLVTYLKLKDPDGGGPRDNANYNISRHFPEAIRFIDAAIQSGGNVAGRSRSGSIVLAYLMWRRKMNFRAAFELVNGIRDLQLNAGFESQLEEFDKAGWTIEK